MSLRVPGFLRALTRAGAAVVAAAVCLGAPAPAAAQAAAPSAGDTAPDAEPQVTEVTLAEALARALDSNITLYTARLDYQSALERYGSAWGAFDSVYFFDVLGSKTETAPTPSNLVGGIDVGGSSETIRYFFDYTTGFRGTLLTGTTWQFDVGARRIKTVDAIPDGMGGFINSDIYIGGANMAITQPLLRNGGSFARQSLDLARQDVYIAAASAGSIGLSTLESIIVSYWNLVFAIRNVSTKAESVALAQELVDITSRKFDQGLQTRIDEVEVEAELAQRREEQLTAVNVREDANEELVRLVFAPDNPAAWERTIVPLTEPDETLLLDSDLTAAINTALARRPDVTQARLELSRSIIELERAENQALPRFDVTGNLGTNSNEDDLRDSVLTLNDTDFYETGVTLGFEMPIGNRTAGYEVRRARVQRERAAASLRDVEMLVIQEVRSAMRGVRLQHERVQATSETTRLNRELYEGERRRLEKDLSTPFQVRQTLQNLLDAIDTELRARLDLEVARTRLLTAQGTLLEHYGFERPLPRELPEDERPPAP